MSFTAIGHKPDSTAFRDRLTETRGLVSSATGRWWGWGCCSPYIASPLFTVDIIVHTGTTVTVCPITSLPCLSICSLHHLSFWTILVTGPYKPVCDSFNYHGINLIFNNPMKIILIYLSDGFRII